VPEAAIEAFAAAVNQGEFRKSVSRVGPSVRRIIQAKARLGLNTGRRVDVKANNQKSAALLAGKKRRKFGTQVLTRLRIATQSAPWMEQSSRGRCLLAFYADPSQYGEDLEQRNAIRDSTRDHACEPDTKIVNANVEKIAPPESYDVAILALFVRVSEQKEMWSAAEQAALGRSKYTKRASSDYRGIRKPVFA